MRDDSDLDEMLTRDASKHALFVDEILEAYELVRDFFEGDTEKARWWMRTPNPNLGYVAPSTMCALGRGDRLLAFVKECREDCELRNLSSER